MLKLVEICENATVMRSSRGSLSQILRGFAVVVEQRASGRGHSRLITCRPFNELLCGLKKVEHPVFSIRCFIRPCYLATQIVTISKRINSSSETGLSAFTSHSKLLVLSILLSCSHSSIIILMMPLEE